jgi:endonuclease G
MGYNENFLIRNIPMPACSIEGSSGVTCLLDYTNFSIFYSKTKKLPACCAVNIDGSRHIKIPRSPMRWRYEPKLDKTEQTGPEFYNKTYAWFHRGHMVRRIDPCWGDGESAKLAEEDTFHYTNTCPQHKEFNTVIWLELERSILDKGAVSNSTKISVFTGPVLKRLDFTHIRSVKEREFHIPTHFWKIVVWQSKEGELSAVGFMQSQLLLVKKHLSTERKTRSRLTYFENLRFKNDAVYQVRIPFIEKQTGIRFGLNGIRQPFNGNRKQELAIKEESMHRNGGSRNRSASNPKSFEIIGLTL